MPDPILALVGGSLVGGLAAALIAWRATGAALIWLRRRAVLDLPNDRSLHSVPTPRGGGIGLLAGLVPVWAATLAWSGAPLHAWAALAAALALAALSFLDDRRGLSAGVRFGAQGVALAAPLALLPADALLLQGLAPLGLDRAVAFLAWLWFVNLYNFMDGIDGITGVETGSIGLGAALIGALVGDGPTVGCGLALLGASLGFLRWNWRPAKLFMGDVGSIPLGVLVGWLLLRLASGEAGAGVGVGVGVGAVARDEGGGLWAAALILPAYYLADATFTLIRRALRGEKIWRAHRQHFYQQAVQGGLTHDRVALMVLRCDVALILCALVAAAGWPAAGLAVAAGAVAGLLVLLARAGRRGAV